MRIYILINTQIDKGVTGDILKEQLHHMTRFLKIALEKKLESVQVNAS